MKLKIDSSFAIHLMLAFTLRRFDPFLVKNVNINN